MGFWRIGELIEMPFMVQICVVNYRCCYHAVQSYVDLCDVLPSPSRDAVPECCTERQIRIHNRSLAAISDLTNSTTATHQFTRRASRPNDTGMLDF